MALEIELLTEDERLAQICREYWHCDDSGKFALSVVQVAKAHSMKSGDVSKVAYNNCNAFDTDIVCTKCGEPFIFNTRSDYQQALRYPKQNGACPACRANEMELQKAQRDALIKEKVTAVKEAFAFSSPVVPDIHALSFEDAVYLLSFVRATASENLTVFGPLNSSAERLAPSEKYSVKIVKHLFAKSLVLLHPDSTYSAFDFDDGKPVRYTVTEVLYALPTCDDVEGTKQFIAKLEATFRIKEWWPYKWHDQKLALWRKVALEECLEYLIYVLKQHNLPFNAGEKTLLTLESLLEQYSVAQLHTIIWSSGQHAAAFYQRGGVTKQHAANTIISRMQNYGEKAIAESWGVKHGRRDFNCPQSVLSRVLFDTALKIGSKGFNEVPHALEEVEEQQEEGQEGTD